MKIVQVESVIITGYFIDTGATPSDFSLDLVIFSMVYDLVIFRGNLVIFC